MQQSAIRATENKTASRDLLSILCVQRILASTGHEPAFEEVAKGMNALLQSSDSSLQELQAQSLCSLSGSLIGRNLMSWYMPHTGGWPKRALAESS